MQRGQIALGVGQARFEVLPQFFAEYTFIYTAHTLTVPVVCHFGHFVVCIFSCSC